MLWDSCYESGEDYVGTAADIETMLGWTGAAGELAAALVDAGKPEGQGFIEPIENGATSPLRYRVHDLWHHAPDYVAKRRKRELDRLHKIDPAAERGVGRSAPFGGQQLPSLDWQDGDGRPPSPSPSHSPSPSPMGQSVSSATPSASREPLSAALLVFPTIGKGGNEWALTQAQVNEWQELYQGLDVVAECRKALAWVKAKTGNRKTAGGMKTFLVNWFNRGVGRGANRQQVEREFSDLEIREAQQWYRSIGTALDRSISQDEHMSTFIRNKRRRLQEAS